MRLKRNIIIAIVAILLCIAAFVTVSLMPDPVPSDTQETWTETEDTSVVLVNYKKGSYVNSKIIVECEKNPFTLKKTVDTEGKVQYIVETHPGVEVDNAGINALAENFSMVVMADTIDENPKDLSVYGLDNPQGKYTLVNEDGSTKTVLIGDAIGSMYYSMIDGDKKVYIIFGGYGNAVLSGINGYRETTFVNIENTQIGEKLKSLKIEGRDGFSMHIRIATENDRITSSTSRFVMTKPYNMPVYASKLMELMPSLCPIYIDEFVEDNPSNLGKYGLSNPAYTLTIEDMESTTVVYFGDITEDGASVYCKMKDKDFVFKMGKTKLDALKKVDPYTLCDRYAHLINITEISSVQVVSADGSRNYNLVVDREGQDLFRLNGKVATEESVRTAYRYITGMSLSADGGDNVSKEKEAHRVVFNFTDGTSYKAVYYEYDDRNYVIDRNGEKSNFLVAKKSVEEMYEKLEAIETK